MDCNFNLTYILHFSPVLQSEFVKHRWNIPVGLTKSALYKQLKEINSRVEIISVAENVFDTDTDLLH